MERPRSEKGIDGQLRFKAMRVAAVLLLLSVPCKGLSFRPPVHLRRTSGTRHHPGPSREWMGRRKAAGERLDAWQELPADWRSQDRFCARLVQCLFCLALCSSHIPRMCFATVNLCVVAHRKPEGTSETLDTQLVSLCNDAVLAFQPWESGASQKPICFLPGRIEWYSFSKKRLEKAPTIM